eukprot:135093_1
MCETIELLTDILDGFKILAESVTLLSTGLTFGLIPSITNIEQRDINHKFTVLLAFAAQSVHVLYLTAFLIISMYYDIDSVYNIITLSIALGLSFWFTYLIKNR